MFVAICEEFRGSQSHRFTASQIPGVVELWNRRVDSAGVSRTGSQLHKTTETAILWNCVARTPAARVAADRKLQVTQVPKKCTVSVNWREGRGYPFCLPMCLPALRRVVALRATQAMSVNSFLQHSCFPVCAETREFCATKNRLRYAEARRRQPTSRPSDAAGCDRRRSVARRWGFPPTPLRAVG